MINICFQRNKDDYIGYIVNGHANYDENGKDIVCAGVSALAFAGVNALMMVADIPNLYHTVDDNGKLSCSLPSILDEYQESAAQIIFETVYVGFQGIQNTYGDYIKIDVEEV